MQALAEFIANIISLLFGLFQDVDISGISQAVETLTPFIKTILYILPARTISNIFSVIVMFWSYKIIVRTLKLIWDIIPWL